MIAETSGSFPLPIWIGVFVAIAFAIWRLLFRGKK
jgi:hypothetical protein